MWLTGIRVLARRSSDHLAVRLLIVLTSPHSYRSPVDRVTGLLAPAPAKRAIAKRFRALAAQPTWQRLPLDSTRSRLTQNVISTVIRCAAKGSLDYPVDSNKSGDGDPAEPEITGLAPSRGQVMLLMKPG